MSRPGTGRRIDVRRSMIYEGRAWTPADIALTRIARYENRHTDDGGGPCSVWFEEVAAKNATAATTARPTIATDFNNHEVLDFDGTTDVMVSNAAITGGHNTATFAWIGSTDNAAATKRLLETNTSSAGAFAIFTESGKLSVSMAGAAGQDYVAGNTSLVNGTKYLFIVEIPFSTIGTAEIKSWVNGVQQTQSVIANTATNTTMITSVWTIGKWVLAGAQFFDGRMAYLDAWAGAFTATETANFYTWAKANYGVA
jgi:hypothetical protein